jgi:hypothetical protein
MLMLELVDLVELFSELDLVGLPLEVLPVLEPELVDLVEFLSERKLELVDLVEFLSELPLEVVPELESITVNLLPKVMFIQ